MCVSWGNGGWRKGGKERGRQGQPRSLGDFHSALVAGFPMLPPTAVLFPQGTQLAEPGLKGWSTLWRAPHQAPLQQPHSICHYQSHTASFCYMTNHQMSRERADIAFLHDRDRESISFSLIGLCVLEYSHSTAIKTQILFLRAWAILHTHVCPLAQSHVHTFTPTLTNGH